MIKTAQDIKSYKKQLKEALGDKFLRSALDMFNTTYRDNRPNVYADIDFDFLKAAATECKAMESHHSLFPFEYQ